MSKQVFFTLGKAEGISFLLLLFIAMPLKYLMNMPLAVTYTGWLHGLLFVLYIWAIYRMADSHNWGFKKIAVAFFAGLFPFGPFIMEKWLK